MDVFKTLTRAASKISESADIGIVLGSGLGNFVDTIEVLKTMPYDKLDGFATSGVVGHKGQFVFGYCGGKRIVAMQGRVHYYEGYTMDQVVMPIRLMKLLGVKHVVLTNAAGGISCDAGDLMAITDHINLTGANPLIGRNIDELGVRFPDMTEVYDQTSLEVMQVAADALNVPLKKGVYAQLSGPSYETPAEINMLKILGANAVGMSTACEAIAARHCGMKVSGISMITNAAAGLGQDRLDHAEVIEIGKRGAERFQNLLVRFIGALPCD